MPLFIRNFERKSKEEFSHGVTHFRTFIKWCLCAVIIGAVVGCVGTLFHSLIKISAETFAMSGLKMVWLLPLVGVVIVAAYKYCGMDNDKGTNMILVSVRSEEKPPIFTAPLIFVSTVLTHLAGGSAGREGAAIQMGGGIGYQIGRLLRLDFLRCSARPSRRRYSPWRSSASVQCIILRWCRVSFQRSLDTA